jgi:hypothetical protein
MMPSTQLMEVTVPAKPLMVPSGAIVMFAPAFTPPMAAPEGGSKEISPLVVMGLFPGRLVVRPVLHPTLRTVPTIAGSPSILVLSAADIDPGALIVAGRMLTTGLLELLVTTIGSSPLTDCTPSGE